MPAGRIKSLEIDVIGAKLTILPQTSWRIHLSIQLWLRIVYFARAVWFFSVAQGHAAKCGVSRAVGAILTRPEATFLSGLLGLSVGPLRTMRYDECADVWLSAFFSQLLSANAIQLE